MYICCFFVLNYRMNVINIVVVIIISLLLLPFFNQVVEWCRLYKIAVAWIIAKFTIY